MVRRSRPTTARDRRSSSVPKNGPTVWPTISSWQPEVNRRQRFEIVIGELGVRGPRDLRLGHSPLVDFLSQPIHRFLSTFSHLYNSYASFYISLQSFSGAESSLRPSTDRQGPSGRLSTRSPSQVLSATQSCSLSNSLYCTSLRADTCCTHMMPALSCASPPISVQDRLPSLLALRRLLTLSRFYSS